MSVKTKPDGYHTATPYLIISRAAAAIEFYKKAFGAKELFRMDVPGGKIGHAAGVERAASKETRRRAVLLSAR